jgi:DNA topoisomerase III
VREAPPLLFDLGTLQEVCSRQFGLDVQDTLDIAQSLYEQHKATTYPRSDCGYLPESMLAEAPQVLAAVVAADPKLAPTVATLDRSLRSRAWDDAKITAHHGIIPTIEPPNLAAMSEKELQVYRLIRAHYLAQFLPAHEFDRTTAQFSCSNVTLRARGKRIVVRGWRSVLDTLRLSTEGEEGREQSQELPPLAQGAACAVSDARLRALKTLPPKPYTQGDLVKAMKGVARWVSDPRLKQKLKDTTGIGTEATRAGIIQGLITRDYLVKQGRAIRASPTACTLIDAIPAIIADPGMTAVWEQALDLIAARQLTLEAFVEKQSAWVAKIVRDHAHSTLVLQLPEVPACPICGARTRQRSGASGTFWSCRRYPECKGTVATTTASSRPSKAKRRRRSARR